MQANTKDLTQGSIRSVLLGFAAPLFLSQLFQQLYNSADALIVGNFLGKEALAAVSSSGPLIFLLIGFFNGASTGAGVVISRYFGAQDTLRVRKAIHTTVADFRQHVSDIDAEECRQMADKIQKHTEITTELLDNLLDIADKKEEDRQ